MNRTWIIEDTTGINTKYKMSFLPPVGATVKWSSEGKFKISIVTEIRIDNDDEVCVIIVTNKKNNETIQS